MTTTTTTIERNDETRPDAPAPPAPAAPHVEDRRDRVALAREAGWRRISFGSVLAGVFVAYGAFAILLGIVSAVLDAVGVDTDGLTSADWRGVGIASAVALFLVLFVTYCYGGYVAGRMARRSGVLHGVCVFVVGLVLLVAAAGAVLALDGASAISDRLRDLGAPTSSDSWIDIGSIGAVAGLLAMLLGSMIGGARGERWHQRLVVRAASPDYGPDRAVAAPPASARDEQPARDESWDDERPDDNQPDDDRTDGVARDGERPAVAWSMAPNPTDRPPDGPTDRPPDRPTDPPTDRPMTDGMEADPTETVVPTGPPPRQRV